MCRNFNVFLQPIALQALCFEASADQQHYRVRPRAAIEQEIARRIARTCAIAEDCSKKSTKAGYDASGMAVSHIPMGGLLERLEQMQQTSLPAAELPTTVADLQQRAALHMAHARDGGDLLKTWDYLYNRLALQPADLIINWETHVRQASQGDMYSESNAHPHTEYLARDTITLYTLNADGSLDSSPRPRTGGASLFYDTHNGDINDAAAYKRLLEAEGFTFTSNSDSCVEPALKRLVYEHLLAGRLDGLLHHLQAQDMLRDDERSPAAAKIASLLATARTMAAAGAEQVTIAAALVARIFEYSRPDSKFVFQSYTPLGAPAAGCIGGGTYTTVRGGDKQGGEEGGEMVFHLPRPYDERNYGHVAMLAASEENALKEQVALLDAAAWAQGQTRLAQPEVVELEGLPDMHATAAITEGVAPIFDVYPGELVEMTGSGQVRLFDIYTGQAIPLVGIEGQPVQRSHPTSEAERQHARHERLAALKVFQIDYFDQQHQPIPCPFNKYGEEIIIIQPLALQRNTERLFAIQPDGSVHLRTGPDGLGLTFGTDATDGTDEAALRERARRLTHIITGAAGTSHLINCVAAEVARKLKLHTLPVVSLDGFTGSDTLPPYLGKETFFLANSNSGGTSDTIKLTRELASLAGVLTWLEEETSRRPADLPDVAETRERLAAIRAALRGSNQWDDLPPHLRSYLLERTPWVYVITNIEASALGNIGRGLDNGILTAAGAGITNLPEEECVGSTFAAMASLQWQIALHTHLGELRGDISPAYAAEVYRELVKLPAVAARIARDQQITASIQALADEFVGGNFDFVFTGYLNGVAEEQAHKAAEMIQEMFVGWHFFLFQHGKYAHMKRRTRYSLGSILGHNTPPPSWPTFNARGLKSPREIGPRVATSFVVAHESDYAALQAIPEYAPDYIFLYPEDSMVLYPFQAIIISHLISYFWGLKKKAIGQQISTWNEPFIAALCKTDPAAATLPPALRQQVALHARSVLQTFLEMCDTTHYFDNVEGQRKTAIQRMLALLAVPAEPHSLHYTAHYATGGFLGGATRTLALAEPLHPYAPLDDAAYLDVLKDLAVELCTSAQAKRLADHFLVEADGRTMTRRLTVARPNGRTRSVYEYDYLIEYEGLGTFYDVEPVHPPKIAKAKKGWL